MPSTVLHAVPIRAPARLRAIRPAWEELLARSSNREPTSHPAWVLPWWTVFGEQGGRQLASLEIRDGERLVGLVPLVLRPSRHRRVLPFRRLELLATGEAEADESCSDYVGVIAEAGREDEVAKAFVSALARGELGPWDELVGSSMNGASPMPAALARALEAEGMSVSLEQTGVCPYVELPKTWDAYLAALKGNKRSQLKRALRAFEAWAGGPPVIERVSRPEDLEDARATLVRLHAERWQSDGVFGSRHFRAFHDQATRDLLAAGMLDLGAMRVRGEPIAAFYNLRCDGKSQFYQGGRKVDVPDDVRVGVTMHAYLIRGAIEQGLREYDFLAGDSQYKMSLATATRPLVTLRAARPGARESLRTATERAIVLGRAIRESARARRAAVTAKLRAARQA
jgi:CelD/BcsL family acetyltransferase involved in cellulose biosynthesis